MLTVDEPIDNENIGLAVSLEDEEGGENLQPEYNGDADFQDVPQSISDNSMNTMRRNAPSNYLRRLMMKKRDQVTHLTRLMKRNPYQYKRDQVSHLTRLMKRKSYEYIKPAGPRCPRKKPECLHRVYFELF